MKKSRGSGARRPLGMLSRGVFLFNVLGVVLLILCYLAPLVPPQRFWPVAIIGISYPILLIIHAFFITYWLYRRPGFACLSLLAVGLGWGMLSKTIGFNSSGPQKGGNTFLSLMSYNVHMFKDMDQAPLNPEEFLELFQQADPDIICLQEFYSRGKGKLNIQEALIRRLGYKHHFFKKVAQNDFDAYGIAIFSKYPIVHSGSLNIHRGEKNVNRIQFADILKDSVKVRVYNVHLQSIGFQKEDYEFIHNKSLKSEKDIHSTRRIGGRLVKAFIQRGQQADSLYKHVLDCEYPYLVAGDFNDTPSSYAVNRLSRLTHNAFQKKGKGWGITYNGAFPNFQIDYILASKDFQVRSFQVIEKKLSDHYPIWTELGYQTTAELR